MAGRDGGKLFDAGIIAVAAGRARVRMGNDRTEFFGPGSALAPVAPEAAGRQFDYPFAVNSATSLRSTEAVDFPTLRALADSYDILRLALETRKDQMGKLTWGVQLKGTGEQDATAEAIEAFLQEPDGEHDFGTWFRMLLEDLMVLDAPCVYVRRTLGGAPFAFEVIDGATIKRLLDGRGRTPLAPDPAYQQIIKGMPAVDYSRDELLYKPRNPRAQKVYGFGPVEQVILTVNIALRRQVSQLQYYTEGNIPDMLASVPKTWSAQQIKEFQLIWDELMAGDSAARRRLRFLPGEMALTKTQTESLFDQYDEWLSRVICYAFSLPPGAFVKQQNRATAESSQEVALEEGLAPLMEWATSFMNRLIRMGWGTTDYEFAWKMDVDVDPQVQAGIDHIYITDGVRRVNEVRADHGWEPDDELEARKMAPPPPPPGTDPNAPPGASTDTTQQPGEDAAKLLKARARRRSYATDR